MTLEAPDGPLRVFAFHATPPVFDGPEDRNGRRNHDEAAFWLQVLDEEIGGRFVLLGDANLDPSDGEGRPGALNALLGHPKLQDPRPRSVAAAEAAFQEAGANRSHKGEPALDTANWRDVPGPGNLRVDYVLPSADWTVTGAGVAWPDEGSRHGLVWVDLGAR